MGENGEGGSETKGEGRVRTGNNEMRKERELHMWKEKRRENGLHGGRDEERMRGRREGDVPVDPVRQGQKVICWLTQ